MSEPDIEASLKRRGYILMTTKRFSELIDKVEQAILDGDVCLPLTGDEVWQQIG